MRPPIPTLETRRLALRPFTPEDAPAVQQLAGAREVAATTLSVPHPYEDGMAEEWIDSHADDWAAQKSLALAITTADDGLVGAISLSLSPEHRRGELGYWVGQPFWNRGYATEAAAALVRFGFERLGLNRICAHLFGSNPASGRVMEKLGMRREGVLREHIVKWGVAEDIVLYGILASEHG